MTRVCLVGSDDYTLEYELLSRETAREALETYDLFQPYANTIALETISLGAAVAFLNDVDWYLTRFTDDALVSEPSVSEDEWLSRGLATAIRDGRVDPADTDRKYRVYGVVDGELRDPLYVTRTGGGLPEYDLYDVDDTLPVRVTDEEFEQ